MKPYLRTLEGEANFAPHRPRLQARGPGDEGSFLYLTREDLAAMSQKELDVLSQRAKDKSTAGDTDYLYTPKMRTD